MDTVALETFITSCDDLLIAQEGLKGVANKIGDIITAVAAFFKRIYQWISKTIGINLGKLYIMRNEFVDFLNMYDSFLQKIESVDILKMDNGDAVREITNNVKEFDIDAIREKTEKVSLSRQSISRQKLEKFPKDNYRKTLKAFEETEVGLKRILMKVQAKDTRETDHSSAVISFCRKAMQCVSEYMKLFKACIYSKGNTSSGKYQFDEGVEVEVESPNKY